jgi:cyclic pyranopterin phosphate synthase
MEYVHSTFPKEHVIRLQDAPNDTSKNYTITGYKGSFAIISSVTNPFCDSCNRLRLTANGQLKNCLFSSTESDLLTTLRKNKPIAPVIERAVRAKFKVRGGMDTLEKLVKFLDFSFNQNKAFKNQITRSLSNPKKSCFGNQPDS